MEKRVWQQIAACPGLEPPLREQCGLSKELDPGSQSTQSQSFETMTGGWGKGSGLMLGWGYGNKAMEGTQTLPTYSGNPSQALGFSPGPSGEGWEPAALLLTP